MAGFPPSFCFEAAVFQVALLLPSPSSLSPPVQVAGWAGAARPASSASSGTVPTHPPVCTSH
eukprot:CAMPEP_0181325784 /NCGR_PEP_ID=MMETSP1101-20121128/21126_1 /TAXON_ID=46948 /ORGANISM="Rhodomonas abbreviata, Strain Caron Lab Isolate" /LENGTH=61 /DNA_ID=CAMNT_0023434147 /DNA_START=571 /DNA_END=753 /DNA_ORIENTATION=+